MVREDGCIEQPLKRLDQHPEVRPDVTPIIVHRSVVRHVSVAIQDEGRQRGRVACDVSEEVCARGDQTRSTDCARSGSEQARVEMILLSSVLTAWCTATRGVTR